MIFTGQAIPEPTTGCWLWIGRRDASGYGRTGRGDYAHRAAWLAAGYRIGPKASGAVLHHRCHQRACVNPAHLEIKDRGQHMRDHNAPRTLTPEARRAKRAAYMRGYLPRWRAQRAAGVLSCLPEVPENAGLLAAAALRLRAAARMRRYMVITPYVEVADNRPRATE